MYNFERGRVANREVELALQEVQDVLNLVDVLARATGNLLNANRKSNDECFSSNVSEWLFDKKQGSRFAVVRRREREIRAAHIFPSTSNRNESDDAAEVELLPGNRSKLDLHLLRKSEEAQSRARYDRSFSSSGSYADGPNISSSYYSSQLLSHSLSSTNNYASPRSRYLENQTVQLSKLRDRLSAIDTKPVKSACELVGPIAANPRATSCQNRKTSGVTVSLSSGCYSEVRSCVAKSKCMFGDFASPSNPNYKTPWETSREGRARMLRNYYR